MAENILRILKKAELQMLLFFRGASKVFTYDGVGRLKNDGELQYAWEDGS